MAIPGNSSSMKNPLKAILFLGEVIAIDTYVFRWLNGNDVPNEAAIMKDFS
jgi:hypothetical protein